VGFKKATPAHYLRFDLKTVENLVNLFRKVREEISEIVGDFHNLDTLVKDILVKNFNKNLYYWLAAELT
jgi:hypothetical protein